MRSRGSLRNVINKINIPTVASQYINIMLKVYFTVTQGKHLEENMNMLKEKFKAVYVKSIKPGEG